MCRYKLEDDVDIDEHFNKELFAIMQWMFPKHVDEDENNANASQNKVSRMKSLKDEKRKNAEGNDVMFPKHIDEDESNVDAFQGKVSSKNGKRKNTEGNGVATKRSKRVKNEVDYNET